MRTRGLRLLVVLAAGIGGIGTATVQLAPAAQACIPDPSTGKCVPPPPVSHPYQVTGADSQGLADESVPHSGHLIKWFANGVTLYVACQVNNGDQEDGRTQYGHPFTTWDQLNDGTFVYDWYMNTPTVGTDGYSAGIAHCATSNPQPPGGGAGPYQVTGTDSAGLAVHSVPQSGGVLRFVPNGTSLAVSCQINDGAQVDGQTQYGFPFTTWDQLTDGTWVYDWYMTTPVVATDGYSPGMPHCQAGSVSASAISPTAIHVSWTDSSSGQASYEVTDGNTTRSTAQGATGLDWTGVPQATTDCFEVRSVLNGYDSSWSAPSACATTPRAAPWCPSADTTRPTCDSTGAFQIDCATTAVCTTPANDYFTQVADDGDDYAGDHALEGLGYMNGHGWSDAAEFLDHYLHGTGADLGFSSVAAYDDGPGFASAVNATAAEWISEQRPFDTYFDTGYLDFPPNNPDGSAGSTSIWQSADWENAVGHGFYRLVGTRTASGAWSVALQLTSYYQFRTDQNFPPVPILGLFGVRGADMRHLEEVGRARNFREVGTGTLTFNPDGTPG